MIRDGVTVLLRLGEPASPAPAPVASLLLEHIADRDNMNTATNPASRGFSPAAAARGAAIRQQLLEMPIPVVAEALGYHDKTTTRLRNETGGAWSRYAPEDHSRSPAGWAPKGAGDR
ncbi:hypothetical protein [Streptomyces cupreus]|uniref:hypothetical protein n=1 Tax=Streptomyces cupreus TaxID=2759956 RepID=UPI001C92730A|nr:hypothetical protein [Streptomyces cupreus]